MIISGYTTSLSPMFDIQDWLIYTRIYPEDFPISVIDRITNEVGLDNAIACGRRIDMCKYFYR